MDTDSQSLVEEDDFNEDEVDLLRRASCRLSEILPRRLRFSVLPKPELLPSVLESSNQQGLQVFVRVRPSGAPGIDTPITAQSETQLRVRNPARRDKEQLYQFSHVFGTDCQQEQVYERTTAPLVADMLQFKAKCSVVMAYGSSGAGKTHTIKGTSSDAGLLQRTLMHVLKESKDSISMSYYEVYNDVVYDLLEAASGAKDQAAGGPRGHLPPVGPAAAGAGKARPLRHALLQPVDVGRRALRVREDASGRVVIPGLTQLPVTVLEDALEVIQHATRQRQQATTGVNTTSSRSHCVFTLHVTERVSGGGGGGRVAVLSLVDLAGSERLSRTGNQGERLRESCSINSSLMTLGRCLQALRVNQHAARTAGGGGGRGGGAPAARVVPYREAKITHLFKDVLHGHGHICLLVALSPQIDDLEESLQVLKYAQIALGISLTIVPCAPAAATVAGYPGNSGVAGDVGQDVKPGATAAEVEALTARIAELEEELAQVQDTLDDTQAACEAAEAGVREEVVAEVAAVIKELRASYEDQLKDLVSRLAERDKQVLELQHQLSAYEQAALPGPAVTADQGGEEAQMAGVQAPLQVQVEVLHSPQRKGRHTKRKRDKAAEQEASPQHVRCRRTRRGGQV